MRAFSKTFFFVLKSVLFQQDIAGTTTLYIYTCSVIKIFVVTRARYRVQTMEKDFKVEERVYAEESMESGNEKCERKAPGRASKGGQSF